MSERTPGGGDEAMDLDVLTRDDVLLDALGRGEPAPDGDAVAAMLAAWHADLDDDVPASVRPAVPAPVAARATPDRPAGSPA
ncbi:anti-sigma-D factor RsdA, partial [Micromonospora sp. NPDC003776]